MRERSKVIRFKLKEARHSPGVKQVLTVYPAAIGSKNWPEIQRLANAGEIDQAKELAAKGEVHPHVRARNIMARNIRIERVELFKRISNAEIALRAMLGTYTDKMTDKILAMGSDPSRLKSFNDLLHTETVYLRQSLRTWFNAMIRDAARMGFKHAGNALLPVFRHNREAMERQFVAEQALFEGKLVFAMKKSLAGRAKPTVSLGDDKWADKTAQIVKKITKSRYMTTVNKGKLLRIPPSERIWDLTTRTEQDLKRIVAIGMSNGENPAVIARKIKKYVSPAVTSASKLGVETGPGVYRSPYRNAMRLARTEMNRTYTQSSVSFAKDKPWIVGMRITLSPAHAVEDECDSLAAGGPYTPDEVVEKIPAHPHCMCYATYEIDKKYLGEEEAA